MALYRVDEADGSLIEIPETSLSGEGKRERYDLQRWLRDSPGAIEPDLFVLSEEYSDWDESNRSIDLLALDRDGRLVVAELKRDEGAFMDLQAIRYAALVAHMTLDQAVAAHERYLQRRGLEGDALQRIMEHLGAEGGDEPGIGSKQPRILLVARDFPQELTTSALWLNQAGLDIRCVRVLPYRFGGDLVLDVAQVIPLPEAEHYMIRIRDREAEQEIRTYPDRAWTREEIERLANLLVNRFNLRLLDTCAETPGTWISLSDFRSRGSVEEQAGWPEQRFGAGALAGLTRRIRKEFGRNNWPMDFDFGHGGDSRAFRLSEEVAAWWRAARHAARAVPDEG